MENAGLIFGLIIILVILVLMMAPWESAAKPKVMDVNVNAPIYDPVASLPNRKNAEIPDYFTAAKIATDTMAASKTAPLTKTTLTDFEDPKYYLPDTMRLMNRPDPFAFSATNGGKDLDNDMFAVPLLNNVPTGQKPQPGQVNYWAPSIVTQPAMLYTIPSRAEWQADKWMTWSDMENGENMCK